MHADCNYCNSRLDRATAYRWLGEPNFIPARHGVGWLYGDLRLELMALDLGDQLLLDYRGSVPDAPVIAIHRSRDDVITAQGPDGWLDAPGRTRWRWQPGADRLERIAFDVVSFLKARRGAGHLILAPPRWRVGE